MPECVTTFQDKVEGGLLSSPEQEKVTDSPAVTLSGPLRLTSPGPSEMRDMRHERNERYEIEIKVGLTDAAWLGVIPSVLGADQSRGAGQEGAGPGAVVEVDPALRLPPHLPAHQLLQPGLGAARLVTDWQPGEVPGVALAVDDALAPLPVSSVTAVLVHRASVLRGDVRKIELKNKKQGRFCLHGNRGE